MLYLAYGGGTTWTSQPGPAGPDTFHPAAELAHVPGTAITLSAVAEITPRVEWVTGVPPS